MKQYTSKDQTAKLIELGFPRPKPSFYENGATWIQCDGNYSIGELIEFLPTTINWTPRVIMGYVIEYSFITEGSELYYCHQNNELIDNLFDMCVKLKEEGVI